MSSTSNNDNDSHNENHHNPEMNHNKKNKNICAISILELQPYENYEKQET